MSNIRKKPVNNLYGYLCENIEDRTKTMDEFKLHTEKQELKIFHGGKRMNPEDSEEIETCKSSKNKYSNLKKTKLLRSEIEHDGSKYTRYKKKNIKRYFGSKTSKPKCYKSSRTKIKPFANREDTNELYDDFNTSVKNIF